MCGRYCVHAVTVKRFEKVRSVSFPNPMTLKVTDFPDAVWQDGSPRRAEENKKNFIQIGRAVREILNGKVRKTLRVDFSMQFNSLDA